MSDRSVITSTFTLEREYPVAPATVFAAWADPATKHDWYAPTSEDHELDFRVDGRETLQVKTMTVVSTYHDIVENERIVYTTTLSDNDQPVTVSLTTVEISAAGTGSRLTLIEQDSFLDGHEEPAWRQQGTSDWLDALGAALT
jgi:uncharacterized protein YndB with AHSA1/START domain